MSTDLGLAAANGLNSWMRGMEFGERVRSRKDEQAWNEEVKTRQRADWKATDEQRYKQNLLSQLQAADYALENGLEVDEAALQPLLSQASQFGFPLKQYVTEPESVQKWMSNFQNTLKTGQITPEFMESLNQRFSDEFNRGLGKVERDMQVGDQVIPKGSTIINKRASRLFPDKSGEGMYIGLQVTAMTPDGKTVTYDAPATKRRSTDDDDPMAVVPLQKLFNTARQDQMALEGLEQTPKLRDYLRSQILALGGAPSAQKVQTIKVAEGDQEVTYQVDASGNRKEIGRGNRFSPRQRAAAAGGGGSSGGAGGSDQQMIEYLKGSLFANEPDNAKRTSLAIDKLTEIKGAVRATKDPGEQVLSVAKILMARKKPGEKYGTEVPEYSPQQAIEEAKQLVGALAPAKATPQEEGVDPADAELLQLWGE